jgi:5-methyltetrahydrofolate--homocysteine methyltransferase
MTEALIQAMADMQEKEALQQSKQLLDEGIDPMVVLSACSTAMQTVGERFEKGEYFLPHLIMAGNILKQVSEMIKPYMQEQEKSGTDQGRVLIGTVKGDIHDIGKNMVTFLLEANGLTVNDIGIDQHPDKFVGAIRVFQPDVVGLSGLLTLAFESMKETVQAIEKEGLREHTRIIIGGALVSERVKDYTGADAFAPHALAGVRTIRQWIGG